MSEFTQKYLLQVRIEKAHSEFTQALVDSAKAWHNTTTVTPASDSMKIGEWVRRLKAAHPADKAEVSAFGFWSEFGADYLFYIQGVVTLRYVPIGGPWPGLPSG